MPAQRSPLEQQPTIGRPTEAATNFIAKDVVPPELALAMMNLAPANPFCTVSYAEAMRANGRQVWLLGTERDGKLIAGCYGFISSGHLNRSLNILSIPDVSSRDVFWDGLMRFCSLHRITFLSLNSLASSSTRIPSLPGEVERHRLSEYMLDLEDPEWERRVARKHWQNIHRALQSGVTLRRPSGVDACRQHVRLIAASMQRRRKRGGAILGSVEQKLSQTIFLTERGAGELFQAIAGGETLASGLVLRAAEGAYYETAGNSPQGMKCGASHFLIYSIAKVLRAESIRAFNLGDAEPNQNPGLSLFKSRFGATPVSLEYARCYFGSDLRRKLTGAARYLRQIGSDLHR